MDIRAYTRRYNFAISENATRACQMGVTHMLHSVDRHHEESHVYRMLKNLPALLTEYKDIDITATLLAICWHDTWKARQPFTKSKIRFWFDQIYEGIGSARIFKKEVSGIDMRTKIIAQKAIRRHPRLATKLPHSLKAAYNKTLAPEEKILQDLDALESCSLEFLQNFRQVYSPRFKKYPQFIRTWTAYYKKGFRNINEAIFHTQKAKKMFRAQFDSFKKEADQYIEEIQQYKVWQQ